MVCSSADISVFYKQMCVLQLQKVKSWITHYKVDVPLRNVIYRDCLQLAIHVSDRKLDFPAQIAHYKVYIRVPKVGLIYVSVNVAVCDLGW